MDIQQKIKCKTVMQAQVDEDNFSFEIEWHVHKEVIQNIQESKIKSARSAILNSGFANSSWCLKILQCLADSKKNFMVIYLINIEQTNEISVQFGLTLKVKMVQIK